MSCGCYRLNVMVSDPVCRLDRPSTAVPSERRVSHPEVSPRPPSPPTTLMSPLGAMTESALDNQENDEGFVGLRDIGTWSSGSGSGGGYGFGAGTGYRYGGTTRPTLMGSSSFSPISSETIRSVILRHRTEVHACYEQALRHNRDLNGWLVTHIVISDNGTVTAVEVVEASDEIHDEQLYRCIANEQSTWRFATPAGGTMSVNDTFLLTPTVRRVGPTSRSVPSVRHSAPPTQVLSPVPTRTLAYPRSVV